MVRYLEEIQAKVLKVAQELTPNEARCSQGQCSQACASLICIVFGQLCG